MLHKEYQIRTDEIPNIRTEFTRNQDYSKTEPKRTHIIQYNLKIHKHIKHTPRTTQYELYKLNPHNTTLEKAKPPHRTTQPHHGTPPGIIYTKIK